jgi:hypothetical protein
MGCTGSDVKPLFTVKDMEAGKTSLGEAEMQKLIQEDPEMFKKRAERTRREVPKFAKAMKKQMEQATKQMAPMGGMMDMFDEDMLTGPLNMAIDMIVESADKVIKDRIKYPSAKPSEVVVEDLEAHGKDPHSNQLEIEVEGDKNAEFSLSDNK